MKRWLNELGNPRKDILSGLTVALALVPEAVAFAFVAGVPPHIGLYAAFIIGLITAIFGGRPGMISGATGAIAVVLLDLVRELDQVGASFDDKLIHIFSAVILMGIIQIAFGVLKLGKLVRLIPHPVMLGFVNGLAIVILLSQFGMFQVNVDGVKQVMTGQPMVVMCSLVALTMAIMYFLPKLTKAVPSALAAIAVVSGIVIAFDLPVATVGSFIVDNAKAAQIPGWESITGMTDTLPIFQSQLFSSFFDWELLSKIGKYSLIMALVGLIESLMTLQLVDEITDTRGNANRESIGQGVANILTGFFGGMGGCAMIGQSMINVNSGGTGRLSGISAAVFLLLFMLFGASLIDMIPIAALVGVMFMVVIGTFAWSSLRIINKIPKSDAIVLILVSCLTVILDLAQAVIAGIIVSALVFAWENALHIRVRRREEKERLIYEVEGPLFFGSIKLFLEKFDVKNDPENVVIDFVNSRVADHSGVEAISSLTRKYAEAGKKLEIRHLSSDCIRILKRAESFAEANIIEDKDTDPQYHVSTDDPHYGVKGI